MYYVWKTYSGSNYPKSLAGVFVTINLFIFNKDDSGQPIDNAHVAFPPGADNTGNGFFLFCKKNRKKY